MEYRQLGRSGLRVSRLTLGTMTFGGRGQFRDVGDTDLTGARRQLDMALDAGVNLIDTADVYSDGAAEEIVAGAGRRVRDRALGARPRPGAADLEPAGRRAPVGQIPARRAGAVRLASGGGVGRVPGLRRGQALRHRGGPGGGRPGARCFAG